MLYVELEAATSTTQAESSTNRTSSAEPAEWTIEDVIHYIGVTDPALGQHADLFRKHVSQFLVNVDFRRERTSISKQYKSCLKQFLK